MSAAENLNGKQFQTWYHGTRPENVRGIRENGLRPPSGVTESRWPMVTDSKEQAARYARPGGRVLEYRIPHGLTNYRNPGSVLWPADSHNVYEQPEARAAGVKGAVPGKYIVAEHQVG